jgi:hypothetical protein
MKKNKITRFQYEIFEAGLTDFVEELKIPTARRALRKLKFMVLAVAWTDFDLWDPKTDKEEAMSWAWEDMIMTFAGYGESVLTGAVVSLWSTIPKENWEGLKHTLNLTKVEADVKTPKTVARRYFQTYRRQSVRTPEDGFDLPCLTPTQGPRLREWAAENGHDPDEIEYQMAKVEEYERMGLIDLGNDINVVLKPQSTPEEAISLVDRAIENPLAEAREARGKPNLYLLPWDKDS